MAVERMMTSLLRVHSGKSIEAGDMNCEKPDRHVSTLVCGYPMPCPWHTYVVDVATERVTVPKYGSSRKMTRRLQQIADVLNNHEELEYIRNLRIIHRKPN